MMSLLDRPRVPRPRDMVRKSRPPGLTRKVLLACGVAAPALYAVAHDVLAALLDKGYSPFSQTISELSSIGAPTRPAVLAVQAVYAALYAAFGIGVWQSAEGKRALRVTGALLVIGAVLVPAWWPFPMTGREAIAAATSTTWGVTDIMHMVLSAVTNLLIFVTIGFGAAAFGKWFRLYSVLTLATTLAFGVWMSAYVGRVAASEPTPWLGVAERGSMAAWMAWLAVFAVALLRREAARQAP